MAEEYVGNIVRSPGFWKGNTSSDPELLYSTARFTQKGATLAAGQGRIPLGTIMAQRTADKKWVKYAASGGDAGSAVARGVLRRGIDTGTDEEAPEYQGNIVISGILKLELIKPVNATAAISELNARVDDVFGTFTF